MNKLLLAFSCMLFFISCKTGKEVVYSAPPIEYEEEYLDTLTVSATRYNPDEVFDLPVYNPSATRSYDLLHTDLNLNFDWFNQYVNGTATVTLVPLFYPLDFVSLDAQNFNIHAVTLKGMNRELKYDYDNKQLSIFLDKTYTRNDTIDLVIRYTAKPNEGGEGGSAAITSEKGLFFVNPSGNDPHRPQQIWTQGETENNSRWFPTFDKPNENMTQSITMTVADKFKTLSNGKLTSSVQNANGSRTDTWVQDKPHAPYLTMIAVGDFALVQEEWRGIPLMYLVNTAYKNSAKEIFNHTPEMLSYFSDALDYPYPWDKYAQIVVKDFVTGAMENTNAVIYGESVQKTKRELIDNSNDAIVAHELFHQWFGDLVTCESWANLTLNESFANYAEYLWFEHKYGPMRADQHRIEEINGYLQSYQSGNSHPVIHYGYDDKEAMFDAHSYNKGGLILHMLRSYLGDEAFFASLNKYLNDNAFTAVEVDELRMAFEDTTGEDLNWFFNQWYFTEGHPELSLIYDYSPEEKSVFIYVQQEQDPESSHPVFILPTEVAIYADDGSRQMYSAWVDERKDTIQIAGILRKPAVVVFDGSNDLLAIKKEGRSISENIALYSYSDNFTDKFNALKMLASEDTLQSLIPQLLKEPFYAFRTFGINYLNPVKYSGLTGTLENMAANDPHSAVRIQAIKKLSQFPDYPFIPAAEKAITKDEAYPVINTALNELAKKDFELALRYADNLKEENTNMLSLTLSDIFQKSGDLSYLPWFKDHVYEVSLYHMFNYWGSYGSLLAKGGDEELMESLDLMVDYATNMANNTFQRFIATHTLQQLSSSSNLSPKGVEKIKVSIQKIKEKETHEGLLERYRDY